MSLSSFGVRKPVVANLIMFAIIGLGLVFGIGLRREFFPEVRPNQVIIAAPYPGASPDEIEDSIAIKIEDRIADLDDVKEINTTITEGAASVRIEFESGIEIEEAVARVKREVDALEDLPENSERIVVRDFQPNIPVISVTLYGTMDERTMKSIIREMRDDLRSLPGMGDVLVSGVRTDEIAVEIEPARLVEQQLSYVDIAQRVRQAMQELPGGTVRTATGTVTVKTTTREEQADQIRRIVVKADASGRPIHLDELATVSEGFADVDLITRFNGEACASLTIYALGDEDVLEIADTAKAYVAGRKREPLELNGLERLRVSMTGDEPARAPLKVQAYELGLSREVLPGDLAVHTDLARFIKQRLELLSRNAMWGAILVFLTLFIFLAPLVAWWVTAGLVISVLGTLAVMYWLGITLNLLTMFGLIVVLGLLVDDAIVVAENITTKHEAGEPPLNAAVSGTIQVEWPVVATVITTICAFMPLRLIEGQLGDQLGVLPIVVTCALCVSLIESILILPSHMAHSLRWRENRRRSWLNPIGRAMERGRIALFQSLLIPAYARLLTVCLRWRYVTVATAMAILVACFGLIAGGRLAFNFLTSADAEFFIANLRMPVGTPIDRTDEVVRQIERVASDEPEVLSVLSVIGAQETVDGSDFLAQSNIGQVWVELRPSEERLKNKQRRSNQVVDAVQKQLGVIPGIKSLRFEEVAGGPGGTDIALTVTSESQGQIDAAVERIEAALARQEGVFGVSNDADTGQRELQIDLLDGASELGLTIEQVASQIRGAIYGLEAYTFAGDREDVDVRVMADPKTRRSLAELEQMHIFTPDGRPVPLIEVVELNETRGYSTLRRLDRKRAVTINADVDEAVTNPELVISAIRQELDRITTELPGTRIVPRGRQKEANESLSTLPLGLLVAIALIYVTLAWLFSSYTQPFAVLSVVPFSAIGAILAHYLLGYDMTILSLIGFVALTGIVVNDSLIFMEFYNHKKGEGLPVFDALISTGRARLRAILLTTITTVLGLLPLMLERSFQARFLIPMALTISFGLIAATMVTLIVLPCQLLIGNDALRIWRSLRRHGDQPAPVERSMPL